MAIYTSGIRVANVALSDTFNTWRTRFNETVTDAASTSANNIFSGTTKLNNGQLLLGATGQISTSDADDKFEVILGGNVIMAARSDDSTEFLRAVNAASIVVTAGIQAANVAAARGDFSANVTAVNVNGTNLYGTVQTAAQGQITSVGTLTGGAIGAGFGAVNIGANQVTAGKGAFAGPVTAPVVTANSLAGTVTTAAQPNITSVGSLTSLSVTGNADIGGDLTVSGNVITVSTSNLLVDDNMIYLNANSAVTNPDLGFAGNYNDGSYAHAGLFRDASDQGTWKFFHEYTPEPDANTEINTAHGSFQLANVAMSWVKPSGGVAAGGPITGPTITANTGSVGVLTITDNIKFNNFMREEVNVVADNPAAYTNYDVTTATVQYFTTDADTNWTLNIRGDGSQALNDTMSAGESISLTLLATNGVTPYYQSATHIDGASVTPKWTDGAAPAAGNASGVDAYTFSVIKTGANTFTVLASGPNQFA